MSRVIHFEIPADNPERAAEFDGAIFGWTFRKWDGPMPYWLVTTGAEGERGLDGGLPKGNTFGILQPDEAAS